METKALSSGKRYSNLPESYVRPESKGPRLSEVIHLGCEERSQISQQIADACTDYGFFQVMSHRITPEATEKMFKMATEFADLPVDEKLRLYSDDPSKKMRLSTSFNVNKEKVHNLKDYPSLHCYPLDKYVPEWPSNPSNFN